MAEKFERKFGHKAGAVGNTKYQLNVIPTGSLALDFALGTGGWPLGHPVEVFGAPDIGKSSVLGLNALCEAQAMGKFCVLVALEPGFDPAWAEKNGVNTETLAIGRPDDGEQAFTMLFDAVTGGAEFVLFDSIGAVLRESETQDDAKPSAMGQAALITWGVKRILMPAWKNNVGVMFINQQRDDTKSRIAGLVESPGGHALKHSAAVRVHLKTGGSPYTAKVNGEDMEVGKRLVAVIKRNKLSEGTKRRAEFDFYNKETNEHPVGIDRGNDIVSTGLRTRVIKQAGAFYTHPSFPADKNGKNQIKSKDSVYEFLLDNPGAIEAVRQDVLKVMIVQQKSVKNIKPELEVVDAAS